MSKLKTKKYFASTSLNPLIRVKTVDYLSFPKIMGTPTEQIKDINKSENFIFFEAK